MKRDFDLIRRILHDIEKLPAGESLQGLEYSNDYDQETVDAHVELLIKKGLIEGEILGGTGGSMTRVTGLTWTGHDFLDATKDDTIWAKARTTVLKPTVAITFDLLLQWLKDEAKKKLGLP
jgi:hypothetical protein